jgi:hypothetical protein
MTHLAVKPLSCSCISADVLRSVNDDDGLDTEHMSEACAIAAQKFLIQEVTTYSINKVV